MAGEPYLERSAALQALAARMRQQQVAAVQPGPVPAPPAAADPIARAVAREDEVAAKAGPELVPARAPDQHVAPATAEEVVGPRVAPQQAAALARLQVLHVARDPVPLTALAVVAAAVEVEEDAVA